MKALILLAALSVPAAAQDCAHPQLMVINGNILTGKNLLTPNPERVTALVINQGKITFAGTDAAVRAMPCQSMNILDLHGAFAMPAFNDAHTHLAEAGRQKTTVDLDGTTSVADMQSRIKSFAANVPAGQWVTGAGWDHTKWPSKTLPSRQDLDAVTAGHPALFGRTDGHILVANTAALAAAGITSTTTAPAGGQIDHDPQGTPTGIIRDTAMSLITKHVPPPTPDQRRTYLELAIHDVLAHGVTSIQDYSSWEDFLTLEQMEHENNLKLRVSEWLTFGDPIETLKKQQAHHPQDDPLLHTAMLKGFMDGSLGSRTAALLAPYSDDAANSGLPRYDQKTLDKMTAERSEAGFQIGFHAIGDRANNMALTAFERSDVSRMKLMKSILPQLQKSVGASMTVTLDERNRIEHAQVLSPRDFDRFAKSHVIASMQPSHLLSDMNWATDRLGTTRAPYAYAWKSFLDHGVTLAFGTDYPVEGISPFRGLYAATTRMNEAGTATYQPQERLTIQQAIYAYTQAPAYAQKEEKLKGKLEPGYLADFVVLDRDITTASPQDLLHTTVVRTLLGGETVFTK